MSESLPEPSFLPWAPSSDDPRVQRDIFPLRTCLKTPLNLSKGCRATQRKQLRRHNFDTESCFTVEALNACYAGKGLSGSYTSSNHPMPIIHSHDAPSFGISAAQASVLLHACHSVDSLGPPPQDLSASGALQELRGSVTSYDGNPSSNCPVSYSPGLVSMPDSSNSPVPLQELWDFRQKSTSGAIIIDSFSKHKILPGAIAAEKLKASGDPKPYSDPLLRQPRKYASFLKVLTRAV